jgi:hypothetical protein
MRSGATGHARPAEPLRHPADRATAWHSRYRRVKTIFPAVSPSSIARKPASACVIGSSRPDAPCPVKDGECGGVLVRADGPRSWWALQPRCARLRRFRVARLPRPLPNPEHDLAQVDPLVHEAFEHLHSLVRDTGHRSLCRSASPARATGRAPVGRVVVQGRRGGGSLLASALRRWPGTGGGTPSRDPSRRREERPT